jgi:hypothetical protein
MYSGKLQIILSEPITFKSIAPIHKIESDIKDILYNNASKVELTTRNIQPFLTHVLSQKLGYEILLKQTPDHLLVTLS